MPRAAFTTVVGPSAPPWFGNFLYSTGPGSGWTLMALTGPAFIISPGLIQKSWGGATERAVRLGVALNAAVLVLFAFVPVLLGMIGRVAVPGITDPNAVLPTVLTRPPAALARRDRALRCFLDRSRYVRTPSSS